MYNVDSTEDLKLFSFLHYEKLKYLHDEPKSSIRLVNGMVERLLFVETDDGIEVELIEIDRLSEIEDRIKKSYFHKYIYDGYGHVVYDMTDDFQKRLFNFFLEE